MNCGDNCQTWIKCRNEPKKLPLILFCRVDNEWKQGKRRIAAQNNGKSLVKQQGSWGGGAVGVIIHSTWRQTHCCIDNDQPDPKNKARPDLLSLKGNCPTKIQSQDPKLTTFPVFI